MLILIFFPLNSTLDCRINCVNSTFVRFSRCVLFLCIQIYQTLFSSFFFSEIIWGIIRFSYNFRSQEFWLSEAHSLMTEPADKTAGRSKDPIFFSRTLVLHIKALAMQMIVWTDTANLWHSKCPNWTFHFKILATKCMCVSV